MSCAITRQVTICTYARVVLMSLGWKFLILTIAASTMHFTHVNAREIEKINFAEQLDLGGSKLELNGVGLRTKRKFGMNFKVYVGALYLTAKSGNAEQIMNDSSPKLLKMIFLRSLDAETLREAYQESYEANCKPDCEATAEQMKTFKALMVPVKEKSVIAIQYDKNSIKVDVPGNSETLEGAVFRNVLLRMYIGDKPPTEEFKRGLLGH